MVIAPDRNNNTVLVEALKYHARFGFNVIPLHYKTKEPVFKWKAYQGKKIAEQQIREWFRVGDPRNIGVITGAVSGIVVLDVDYPDKLTEHIPKTPTVKSGNESGKRKQYYFKHPGVPVGNFKLACGEFQADGRLVVAPPSVHKSGNSYEWEISLDDVALADMPDWLLKLAKAHAKQSGNAEQGLADVTYDGPTEPWGKRWFGDCEKLAALAAGERNDYLNTVACKAGSLIAGKQLNEKEAVNAMIEACEKNGLSEDDRLKSVLDTINSGLSEGKRNPRYPANDNPPVGSVSSGKLMLRKASDTEMEPFNWLWEGVLEKGMFSIFGGLQGLGKSSVCASVAAIVSSGGEWPVSKEQADPGNVLIFSGEEPSNKAIVPRLTAAGADLDRVFIQAIDGVRKEETNECFFDLQHLPLLEDAIKEIGNVALIIIDPVTTFSGDANPNSTNDVRDMTTPLAQLAAKHGCSILGIMHLNKDTTKQGVQRFSGAGDWTQAARTVYMVTRRDEELRDFVPAKVNYTKEISFSFRIQPDELRNKKGEIIKTAHVDWEPYSGNKTADQALAEMNEDGYAMKEAIEYIQAMLKDRPVPSGKFLADAKEAGFSERTLNRAKVPAGAISRKIGDSWCWLLKDANAPLYP